LLVRKTLTAVATFTLLASVWLSIMNLVLHHPGYQRQAIVFALFILQSGLTLLMLAERVAWIRLIVLVGALGICYAGWTAVAVQLGRSSIGQAQPQAQHFEGYALLIGLALAVQGVLTILRWLPRHLPRPNA
jgi:NADH:ubiquinone oxidoreductase subunit 6 (subunit J)